MRDTLPSHYLFMVLAIVLEVAANILIKYSEGFSRRWVGGLGIACVLASFAALSRAVRGIDLSIAYAVWGGTGILLTATAGWIWFKQSIGRWGWIGLALIVIGMSLLKLS